MLIEQLPARLESAIADLLSPSDEVVVKIKGAFQEALVCTRDKVVILKAGLMTGNMFGVTTFQLPYKNITSVEVQFGLVSGIFEISSGGVQNTERSAWSNLPATSATRGPNSIALFSSEQEDKFREACRIILALQSETATPTAPFNGSGSVADEIGKLADLWRDGALTQTEFESQKARLLAGERRPLMMDAPSFQPSDSGATDDDWDDDHQRSRLESAMDEAIRARQAASADQPSEPVTFGRRRRSGE